MRAEVRRLKEAIANKDISPILVHLIYKPGLGEDDEGYNYLSGLYASDGSHTAFMPCELGGKRFLVLASDLHSFLDKVDGEPEVKAEEDGTVTVKCGRMTATFTGLDPRTTGFDVVPPKGEEVMLPDNFIQSLRDVRPFVSENAQKLFATCILYRRGKFIATSNIAIVSAKLDLGRFDHLLIPGKVADYLIDNAENLASMEVGENTVCYKWTDGSWYNTTRFSYEFPPIENVLAAVEKPNTTVSEEWRSAVRTILKLGQERMEFRRGTISGKTKQSTAFVAEVETALPDEFQCVTIEPKFLAPVFGAACKIKIYKGGDRAMISFSTDNIYGVAVGFAS